jgi:hypothetical protein
LDHLQPVSLPANQSVNYGALIALLAIARFC